MPKKDQVRPVISSPVGPIKSSRGPDLVRSDLFHVVDGINDCQEASTAPRPAVSGTAASSVTATPALPPSAPSSRFLRRPSFPSFGRTKTAKPLLPTSSTSSKLPTSSTSSKLPKSSTSCKLPTSSTSYKLPTTSTASMLPASSTSMSILPTRARPESIMPASSRAPDAPHPPQPKKLPKLRSMNLQTLRKSISRQNLSARFSDARQTPAPPQVPQPPCSPPPQMKPSLVPAAHHTPQGLQTVPSQLPASRIAASSQIPGPAQASAQSAMPMPGQQHAIRRKPVPSQTPAPSRPAQQDPRPVSRVQPSQAPGKDRFAAPKPQSAFSADSSRSTTPEPDRSQVVAAQPMEYWTGRFSRLNDIYMAADRAPETLLALRSGLLSQHRQHVDLQFVDEDDARHLHIFAQLDFLCATQDAKQSLREFQQVFAQRFNRPILMPEGGMSSVPRNRPSGGVAPPSAQTTGSSAGSPYGTR